jgi:hypothetical protein
MLALDRMLALLQYIGSKPDITAADILLRSGYQQDYCTLSNQIRLYENNYNMVYEELVHHKDVINFIINVVKSITPQNVRSVSTILYQRIDDKIIFNDHYNISDAEMCQYILDTITNNNNIFRIKHYEISIVSTIDYYNRVNKNNNYGITNSYTINRDMLIGLSKSITSCLKMYESFYIYTNIYGGM